MPNARTSAHWDAGMYTTADVARMLEVDERTVRDRVRRASNGVLQPTHFRDGVLRWDRDAFDAWQEKARR